MKQTGFDPSSPQVPPHRRMRVVAGVSADVARNKRADYMRAQAACLDARGYSVK